MTYEVADDDPAASHTGPASEQMDDTLLGEVMKHLRREDEIERRRTEGQRAAVAPYEGDLGIVSGLIDGCSKGNRVGIESNQLGCQMIAPYPCRDLDRDIGTSRA